MAMDRYKARSSRCLPWAGLLAVMLALPGMAAQTASQSAPPPTAKAEAPIDLTGYWVSVVTQDWLYRMVVPAKGEYMGVPMSLAAKQFADGWSPAADIAAGQQCKAYGAGAVMRIPERIHVKWADDQTLRMDTDAGMQTRLLRFAASPADMAAAPSLQGLSTASWVFSSGPNGGNGDPALRGPGALPTAAQIKAHQGWLKVETSHVLPGYLRKNGIPYGTQMHMLEYWQQYKGPDGRDWLFIASEIDDPQFLQSAYDVTPILRREPDGNKFNPTPCSMLH
jgi:hypothetical protein